MIEYGSGASTLLFAPIVKKLVSIEHHPDWAQKVKAHLQEQRLTNVELKHVPPDTNLAWDLPARMPDYPGTPEWLFANYINAVDDIKPSALEESSRHIRWIDIAFIDGRCRPAIAVKLLPYLKPGGVVFIHDFFGRPRYFSVLNFYEEIDAIRDTTRTLIKLIPKHVSDQPYPELVKQSHTACEIAAILKQLHNMKTLA